MAEKPPPKPVSPQDWESLVEDFRHGGARREKWSCLYPSLVELALSSTLRKEFPFKIPLVIFLDEFSHLLFPSNSLSSLLDRLVEALRTIVQSPIDGVHITYALKEQMMVSTTSILISTNSIETVELRCTEAMVELLLAVINRPNHGLDRHARAISCECLRELEKAYPCLLSEIAGHIWSLCQSERTHASQSYILLLTTVLYSIVSRKLSISILNTSVPLIPFKFPQWILGPEKEGSGVGFGLNYKELRRAMAFLLEWPRVLTPCGMMVFLRMVMPLAVSLDLQPSMLKFQFFGLINSFHPVLCHVVLIMYSRFSEAFNEKEKEIMRRLLFVSLEMHQHLVFRLLSVHWLMGFLNRFMVNGDMEKKKSIIKMGFMFYPHLFDPLSLKAIKLDFLAFCSICIDALNAQSGSDMVVGDGKSVVKLFQNGLISVSAFKWLPHWSTETAVAFRTLHKLLIGASSHSEADPSTTNELMESTFYSHLKGMLIDMILEFQRLVPVIVAFVDRLLGCDKHHWLGERLLQTMDENLHPRVVIDYRIVSYFLLFNRFAENQTIPPRKLLELLSSFMAFLVEKHGSDTCGKKSWSHGTKVLDICRTMLTHHQSSRLFLGISRLLAFTCLYFPDLEVRDHARSYLRMMICMPGVKLRGMLNLGEQLLGISSSSQSESFFSMQSPRKYQDPKKSRNISSYIHLERMIPLLVKQSWSLSLLPFGVGNKSKSFGGIRDSEASIDERELDSNIQFQITLGDERVDKPWVPLYVMDSKVSEILEILRRHFSCIPDFRHMAGVKIKLPCHLRFDSETFNHVWGGESPKSRLNGVEALPALCATVLKFSSPAPYESFRTCHIPFLLGQPPVSDYVHGETASLDTNATYDGFGEEEIYKALVAIEFEPREPTPGLVDVFIETNVEDGQIISGKLQSISVGIEDLFLKAIPPPDIPEDSLPDYYLDLFNALWDACSSTSNTGREAFLLKGGKGAAAINGTRSVKLLDIPADSVVHATEHYLSPFVVGVTGEHLVDMVKYRGIIRDIVWKDEAFGLLLDSNASGSELNRMPLQLTFTENEDENESQLGISKRSMGCIDVLIFLPPMFHILLQIQVSDVSTLVQIRTDHWPCLAYLDEYLEALFLM